MVLWSASVYVFPLILTLNLDLCFILSVDFTGYSGVPKNKIHLPYTTEILLKVALYTIKYNWKQYIPYW
jgi:hypothetical protein